MLRSLGVRITSIGSQIRGHCPVHKFVTGHEDSNPSWGMNAVTGAWLCFSCHETGSLPTLVELLGGDPDNLSELILHNAHEQLLTALEAEGLDPKSPRGDFDEPQPYVSAYAFNKNPLPPQRMIESRDLDVDTCTEMNIRWDKDGRCWLLPIYAFAGALIGWQEKSTGYFNNVPKGVMKRDSLFGYQLLTGTQQIIVVESPLDAARFHRYGYEAVSIYGSYVSIEQVAAIANIDPRQRVTVVLAYDNDHAGHTAAYWSSSQFLGLGVDVMYFTYPDPSRPDDPGDLAPRDLHRGVRTASRMMPKPVWVIGQR